MVKRKGARDGRDNKRLNLILVLAIAAIACVGLVATRLMGANTNADTATVVIRDGEQNVYELPLSQNTTKSVTTDLGTNLIEIKDGRAHVEKADCPNQDCVHQGWIDAAGQQIVCLPHKLTVDIVDASAETTYDVVGR